MQRQYDKQLMSIARAIGLLPPLGEQQKAKQKARARAASRMAKQSRRRNRGR